MIEGLPPPERTPESYRQEIEHCYRSVFSTQSGKRVLEDLLIESGLLNAALSDPAGLAFVEGQRAVVNRIMSLAGFTVTLKSIPKENERA